MRTIHTLLLCAFVLWTVNVPQGIPDPGRLYHTPLNTYTSLKDCEAAQKTLSVPRHVFMLCLPETINPNH